jgi:glucan biosynthesis protein C
MQRAGASRVEALDSVRALLMLLGLWIHAAAPYRESARWLVDDAAASTLLGLSSAWLTEFRMPAFFFLAGLLAVWALQRRPRGQFMGRRTLRLLLPLAVALLTLNVAQNLLLAGYADSRCTAGGPCGVNVPAPFALGHLWFLLDLMLYSALLVVAWPMLERLGARLARTPAIGQRTGLAAGVAIAVAAFAAWKLGVGLTTTVLPVLRGNLLGFWSFTWAADHAFFFVAGAALALLPSFRGRIAAAPSAAATLLLGVAGTLALWAVTIAGLTRDSVAQKAVYAVATAVPAVLLTAFAICALLLLHTRVGDAMRSAARWSYSIYLFHHLAIVGVALLLLGVDWPVAAKFGVVLAAGAAIAIACAMLVARVPLLTLLFNGEMPARAPPVAVPAPARGAAMADEHDIPGLAEHPDAAVLLRPVDQPLPAPRPGEDGVTRPARGGAAGRG